MAYCKSFHLNKTAIVSSDETSRATIFENYNARYENSTNPMKQSLVQFCNSAKVDLLSTLVLLFPLLVPFNIDVASAGHAIDLLKTIQCVEYEDLNDTERNQLHQQAPENSFVWVKLFDCNQPSATELTLLLSTLVDACGHVLIFDLLKLIYGYLDANVEKLHTNMPIDVFDSSLLWRTAIIKCIVSLEKDDFIRIHYVAWDCKYDEWISAHSVRIRLLRNQNRQIVRDWVEVEEFGVLPDALFKSEYDFHNCTTGTWERCTIDEHMRLSTTSVLTTRWNATRDLQPAGTLTAAPAVPNEF